ncbi:MAG: Y-family DNA polymerase [Muribaculaceae bacterium]|nr:Y-family DNA polymerase [Muribaculaceae bacterium]
MTGLVDCNNFFVSCERTRNPALEGRPVVVLSNNDGCVVARSNEAKALGIKMGQPAFQIRDLIDAGAVIALSGNHLLYRDLSIKVHAIFHRYAPSAIDYSVDEAFLDMTGIPTVALREIGRNIVEACDRELHLPVTIGFAPTKTLAKIVTELCKKRGRRVGILMSAADAEGLLDSFPIGELWGIGRRLAKRLYSSGVYTAGDLRRSTRSAVRDSMGVNGEKIWNELNGIPCIELSHVGRDVQDSISETRTFPEDVIDFDFMRTKISIYASSCARRLRAMKSVCGRVAVFMRTNRFHTDTPYLRPGTEIVLPVPSSDTQTIVAAALQGLRRIWLPRVPMKRAGVILSDITSPEALQPSLFDAPSQSASTSELMRIIDSINTVPGAPKLRLANQLTDLRRPSGNDGYSSSFQAPREGR